MTRSAQIVDLAAARTARDRRRRDDVSHAPDLRPLVLACLLLWAPLLWWWLA